MYDCARRTCLNGYCSAVQDLLDWFEVDLGFTELLFIQIDLCVMWLLCECARRTCQSSVCMCVCVSAWVGGWVRDSFIYTCICV